MNVPDRDRVRLSGREIVLRPTELDDAAAAFAIQSDWEVTRMLAGARFPPDRAEIERWFRDHPREWRDGEAFRFAIVHASELIGIADIEAIRGDSGSLGYWLSPRVWGLGIATEAAGLLVDFGFGELGLAELRAGHAADNPASGRVLQKLGFVQVATTRLTSRSRGEEIDHHRYLLRRGLPNLISS